MLLLMYQGYCSGLSIGDDSDIGNTERLVGGRYIAPMVTCFSITVQINHQVMLEGEATTVLHVITNDTKMQLATLEAKFWLPVAVKLTIAKLAYSEMPPDSQSTGIQCLECKTKGFRILQEYQVCTNRRSPLKSKQHQTAKPN